MSIFHLTVRSVPRASGRSAVAAARWSDVRGLGEGASVAAQPVTERGRFNALLKEMRSLSAYVERGRSFLEAERERLVAAAKALVQSPVATLRRAVSQIGWGDARSGGVKAGPEVHRQRSKGIER